MSICRYASLCGLALLPEICMASADESAGAPPAAVLSGSIHAGQFTGNSNPQFTGQGGDFALALAVNYQLEEHLAVGVDLVGYAQHFDSGMQGGGWFTAVDDEMQVSTSAVSGQLLYVASAPRAAFYAGGGLGYYRTSVTVDVYAFGFIPAGHVVDQSDSDLGTHLVAGVGLGVSEDIWLDIQCRRTFARAGFREPFGQIDVGGESLMVGLQWRFEVP